MLRGTLPYWQRGTTRLFVAVMTLAITALCSAKVPGMKILDLVIDRETWQIICDEVEITEEAQVRVQQFLNEYWSAIERLDAETHQNTLDAGFQEIIDMASVENGSAPRPVRSRRAEPDNEEADLDEDASGLADTPAFRRQRELRFDIEMAMLQGRLEADRLLNSLLEELQDTASFTDDELAKIGRVVRRQNVLRGFTKSVASENDDFQRPLDLFEVVAQASDKGGEIDLLKRRIEEKSENDKDATIDESDLPKLEDILELYELQIDSLLQQNISLARRPPEKDAKTVLTERDPEFHVRMERRRKAWSRSYDAFALGAEMIRQLLDTEVNEAVAVAWQQRVDRYLCPMLLDDIWMDSVDDWVRSQAGVTAEQIAATEQLKATYETEKQLLIRQIIGSGVHAMKRCGSTTGISPEQVAYARNQLELVRLSRRMFLQLKTLLPRELFELAFDEVKARSPQSLGPRIYVPALGQPEVDDYFHPFGE